MGRCSPRYEEHCANEGSDTLTPAAQYTVDLRFIGRKGTMAISTLISGVFVYLFTVATSAKYQLACTCVHAFFQNAMYGVLYA